MLIVVTEAGRPPIEYRTDATEITIGRSPTCDLVVERPFVSGRHLRILRGGVVHDLGSTNGTFLDGRYLERPEVVGSRKLTIGGFDIAVEVRQEVARPEPAAVPDGRGSCSGDPAAEYDTIETAHEVTALDAQIEASLAEEQLARLRARVGELEGELANARVREAAFTSALGSAAEGETLAGRSAEGSGVGDPTDRPLLLELIETGVEGVPPRTGGTAADFFTQEAFRFLRDVEALVARDAAGGPSAAARVGFVDYLDAIATHPGARAARARFVTHLDDLRRRLEVTPTAYRRASQRLIESVRESLAPDEVGRGQVGRGESRPRLQRALGLGEKALWRRAQKRLEDLTPTNVGDRLEELAREAAREALEG